MTGSKEMQDIIAGLRSLDSINGTNRYGQLITYFSPKEESKRVIAIREYF